MWIRLSLLMFILSVPLAADPQNRRLLVLGDSLSAGYGLEESQAWPALLQSRLEKDGRRWTVLNAGVSGDTSRGGLRRLGWLLKGQPDVVLVALGANDGLRGFSLEETRKNLEAILDGITRAGAIPAMAGMRLPTNYGQRYETRFAAIYPALAEKSGAALLPFLLEGVGGVSELNQADGVHPNAQGQEVVADLVYEFIKPRLSAWEASSSRRKVSGTARVLKHRGDFQW